MDGLSLRATAGTTLVAVGLGASSHALKLIDGSSPPPVPAALRHLHRPIAGIVRLRSADSRASRVRSCARLLRERPRRHSAIVERIGVDARSVTFVNTRGFLVGCDLTVRSEGRIWCGLSAGALTGARLRDPRLDIGCRNRAGRLVGFIWVNPRRGARWIAVDQGSYTELYRTAAHLPVRISSARNVNLGHASATFVVSQYSARGRRLSRNTITAHVAG